MSSDKLLNLLDTQALVLWDGQILDIISQYLLFLPRYEVLEKATEMLVIKVITYYMVTVEW